MTPDTMVDMAVSGLDPSLRFSTFLALSKLDLPAIRWVESAEDRDLPTVLALDGATIKALEQGSYHRVLAGIGSDSTCTSLKGYIPCFASTQAPGLHRTLEAQVLRSRDWASRRAM